MAGLTKSSLISCVLVALIVGAPKAQTITLEEFTKQLTKSHPIFVEARLSPRIEEERRNALAGAEDWSFRASTQYAHLEPALSFSGPERTDAVAIRGGLQRAIWRTGGRLSVSYSATRANLKIDPLFGFPDSYYENILTLSYSHPLIRNRGGSLDRLDYDLQGFEIDLSDLRAREEVEGFLASTMALFLDWSFLTEQRRITQERLRLSEEESSRTQKKRESNFVDQADVFRAQDAVRAWRQSLLLVESLWRAAQAELAVLAQSQSISGYTPLFDLYQQLDSVSLDSATVELLESSRPIRALKISLNQLEESRRGFTETVRPDLSLVAEFNAKRVDAGFGRSLQMDKPDAIIGLRFTVPLGNRAAHSRVSESDLLIARLRETLKNLELELISSYTSLHIQIEELRNVLKLNLEQMESAKKRTEEELKLYNQGRGELTFVIQSRDNEQNAELTRARNALNYHKLLLQRRALADQLYQ
ncbi:MAG: TolC family protein [Candidatus Zixiibacteriota bacterium]